MKKKIIKNHDLIHKCCVLIISNYIDIQNNTDFFLSLDDVTEVNNVIMNRRYGYLLLCYRFRH